MITRVLAVVGLAAAVCLAPTTPTLQSAGVTVEVADMSFTPSVVKVPLGGTVTWHFPGAIHHTTTSDQGFWASGSRTSGASFSHVFASAGAYPYHCSNHPVMKGAVKVPLTVTGSPEGWTLRWSTAKAGPGRSFDVQTRLGSGQWKSFRTDTVRAKGRFHPAQTGTYKVRARSSKGSANSGWSPLTVVPVS